MHKLLQRQLKKLGLTTETLPAIADWKAFVEKINQVYQQSDKDRYVMERGLSISLEETQALNERIKQSFEARQSAILNAFPDLLFLIDEDGLYVEVMAGMQDDLYRPEQELLGKTLAEILPPAKVELFMNIIHKALEAESLQVIEYELDVMGGKTFFEGRVYPAGH